MGQFEVRLCSTSCGCDDFGGTDASSVALMSRPVSSMWLMSDFSVSCWAGIADGAMMSWLGLICDVLNIAREGKKKMSKSEQREAEYLSTFRSFIEFICVSM